MPKYVLVPSKKKNTYHRQMKKRIQDNYLKGVDIKDLALQFGQSPELIEMVLRNQGIEIVSNKQPRSYYRQSKYYPKRKK